MNSQSTSYSNTNNNVFPCKFAMKCTRHKCTFAHPHPNAPITASITKSVKFCRNDLKCTRPDCHFGHSSPALVIHEFIKECNYIERNFYTFWTNEHPTSDRSVALQQYLTTHVHPKSRCYVEYCIETVEKVREDQSISSEMEECEVAIDCINAAHDADNACDDDADNECDLDNLFEEAENEEIMDAFEDELIASEIRHAFESC
jgi:hypothetical protein